MPDDDDVGIERFEIFSCVLEGLAFFERRSLCGKVDDVGREALCRQFETDPRAGGRLDEEIDDGFAAKSGDFLDGALADGLKSACGIQNSSDLFRRKRLDVEEMFPIPTHTL